jgi:hypothetical protein
MEPGAVDRVLAERRASWTAPPFRHTRGILSLYSRVAGTCSEGALMTQHDGANRNAVPEAAEPIKPKRELSSVQLEDRKLA